MRTKTTRQRYSLCAALLLALAALLAPEAALVRAEEAPAINPFATAHVQIVGTISAQGQEAPVQGEGDIDAARGASHLTVALLGATTETIVLDGRTYSRNALTGRWEYTEGPGQGGFNPARLAPYDPATIRAAGRNWARVSAEPVGGVPTTHWRADADLARLIGLPAGAAGGLGAGAATLDLWLGDGDGRIRRMAIDAQGQAGGGGGTAVAAPFRLALTLTFSNFDAPVPILAPPGAVPAATPGATPVGVPGVLPVGRATATAGAAAVRTPVASPLPPVGDGLAPQGRLVLRLVSSVTLVVIAVVGIIAARQRRAYRERREEG